MTCSGRFVTRGDLGDRDGAGVGREDRFGSQDAVEIAKDLSLDLKPLGGGFDGERGGREVLQAGGQGDAGTSLVGLLLRELLFRYFAGDVGADGVEAAVERALIDVVEKDVEAGAGTDVRDAVAHGPGAQDCNGFCFSHRRVLDDFRV